MSQMTQTCPVITTAAGVPVGGNQNSLTASTRGPNPVANNRPGSR